MPIKKIKIRYQINVNFLKEETILKGDLFDINGNKIWDRDKPIKKELIDKLIKDKIEILFYEYEGYLQKNIPSTKDSFIKDAQFEKAINLTFEIENAVRQKRFIPSRDVSNLVSELVECIYDKDDAILNLLQVKEFDDYTYTHSINVALLAILISKKLNFNKEATHLIGMAALLHDIGKLQVPEEIIKKPFSLTIEEYDEIKKHPYYGYEILKTYSKLSASVQKIVLLHHEKISGNGYPLGLKGEEIGDIPQIISIADLIDSITSNRIYKPAKPLWYAIRELYREIGISYHPRIVYSILSFLPLYLSETEVFQKGSFVKLNTGEIGEIVDNVFPNNIRPVILVYINERQEIVRMPYKIYLEKEKDKFIDIVYESEVDIERFNIIKSRFNSL